VRESLRTIPPTEAFGSVSWWCRSARSAHYTGRTLPAKRWPT
jgi:hypothetical protein